ncbi:MAG: formylmethanofuran dehydrogenase subunit A [Planctomycetota bacterium]
MLLIAGGTIYDPANGVDGEVADLWIEGGRIVAPPTDPAIKPERTIDARGQVIMPGGIDMHCHIAGPKVSAARLMRPEENHGDNLLHRTAITRGGTLGSVPSTFAAGYKYAGLGYTTAFDAAIPPGGARHAHAEFHDTPCIDKGFYVLAGNNHYLMKALATGDRDQARTFLAWLLSATKAYAPKLVNPAGVEAWKSGGPRVIDSIDQTIEPFDVSPRQIIAGVAQAAEELGLPHAMHLHCNNLGIPGNWETTLASMQALEGRRGHITHIQFHSYGGGGEDEAGLYSCTEPLVDYVNANSNITVDVGQVLFGNTTSMTGDGPLGHFLANLSGKKWFSADAEMESGCGVSPISYKNKSLVNAVQWAIGLEWFLMIDDPWRLALSTDSPNGASFLAYPQLIRLLMDRHYRKELIESCPDKVRERTGLYELDREYTLGEIATVTRAAPARMLGLTQKGHLGVGADADITVYTPDDDRERMFQLPRTVIKGGVVVIDDGELRGPVLGGTHHVRPEFEPDRERPIREWFEDAYSVQWNNYHIAPEEVDDPRETPCAASKPNAT